MIISRRYRYLVISLILVFWWFPEMYPLVCNYGRIMPVGRGHNNIQNMVKTTGKHYLQLMVSKFEGITTKQHEKKKEIKEEDEENHKKIKKYKKTKNGDISLSVFLLIAKTKMVFVLVSNGGEHCAGLRWHNSSTAALMSRPTDLGFQGLESPGTKTLVTTLNVIRRLMGRHAV